LNLDLASITADGEIDYEVSAVNATGSGSNTLT
jgi:hypothetical protein